MKPRILIVDDEKNTRIGLKAGLQHGYDIVLAKDGFEALAFIHKSVVDLVLTDLKMPGMDGLELLKQITQQEHHIPVILLTAYGSVETAVHAIKEGAYDYVSKPINLDELEIIIARALSQETLKKENEYLKSQLKPGVKFGDMTGSSDAMQSVFENIQQVASSTISVLIEGKSGTGKELVARAIHSMGNRKGQPFIAVNCASLSEGLLESELFGHEKGAFTGAIEQKKGRFELADGGTLFLDEIGEIDSRLQVKLLRVLQEQAFERVGGTKTIHVNVRFVCATNVDLFDAVQKGKFREDLYYRINGMIIHLPLLSQRKEDIPLLADEFLREFSNQTHKRNLRFSQAVHDALLTYDWPGNIRELRNSIENMALMTKTQEIQFADLPEQIRRKLKGSDTNIDASIASYNLTNMERFYIEQALKKTNYNRTKAASLLGVSRRTLHRKLNEYDIKSQSS